MRELITIGDLRTVGPAVRSRARRRAYLNVVPIMGIGQTSPGFVPGATTDTAGPALQDSALALLNDLDLHGAPSEHVSDPTVLAFQRSWNADPANAASPSQLSADGGYGPNTKEALAAIVGDIAPAVNTGGSPEPAPHPTPATPSAPLQQAGAASGSGGLILALALAAAAAYAIFGGKKRSTSVTIRKNPRGRRHRALL